MTTRPDAAQLSTWHELFDHLCIERGHIDNLSLANRLCAENGNQSQEAFSTALKNLQNWRQGVHIPQRRNFVLLGKILEVDTVEDLRARWSGLYHSARSKKSAPISAPAASPVSMAASGKLMPMAAGLLALAVLVAVGLVWVLPTFQADASSAGFEGIEADYRRNVTLTVGESLIIHGARGNECGPAPEWAATESKLPQLTTGTLTDGGVGTRYSRQCGGRVPARAVLFTATTRGVEQTSLYGDPVTITVQ